MTSYRQIEANRRNALRYEATLWRQAGRILYVLETLDRRKPQERMRRFWHASDDQIEQQ
jgi:hypothetical protein